MSNEKNSFIVSDIHGNFTGLFKDLLKYHYNCKVFVSGDCGFGFYKFNFYKNMFTRYNPMLAKKNIKVYFMRGNHDDPKYFSEQLLKFDNLILLNDYEIIDNILFVGGAISIDRMYRVDNRDYWVDEKIIEKDFDTNNVEIVISHEAPLKANPIVRKDILINDELTKDIDESRTILQNIFDKVNAKKWYYGHYHIYKTENIGNTEVTCIPEYNTHKDIFTI